MRRRIFILASWLSLLLAIATTVIGVKGHGSLDQTFEAHTGTWTLHAASGQIMIVRVRLAAFDEKLVNYEFFGFGYRSFSYDGDGRLQIVRSTQIFANAATLAVIFAALPLSISFIFHRRQRLIRNRIRLGLCTACGYSLTANTSGICPECGSPVTEKATT